MRFGIISDSHDRIPMIKKAVEIFNSENLDAVLHCGDFVSPFSLRPLTALKPPVYAVYGNNDGEKTGLMKMFNDNDWDLYDRPRSCAIGEVSIAMLHEPDNLRSFTDAGDYDLIVFGHTHQTFFEKKNGALVVNPGEACGWIKGRPTIAIADLQQGECHFRAL